MTSNVKKEKEFVPIAERLCLDDPCWNISLSSPLGPTTPTTQGGDSDKPDSSEEPLETITALTENKLKSL
tara:strand:+ start:200 stop:409 length:210 start_codon:yes stop_codon:yes gene_type:complete